MLLTDIPQTITVPLLEIYKRLRELDPLLHETTMSTLWEIGQQLQMYVSSQGAGTFEIRLKEYLTTIEHEINAAVKRGLEKGLAEENKNYVSVSNYDGQICAEFRREATDPEAAFLEVWLQSGTACSADVKNAAVEIKGGESLDVISFRIVIDAENSVVKPDNKNFSAPAKGVGEKLQFQVGPADPPDSPIWIYVFQANRMITGLQLTRPT